MTALTSIASLSSGRIERLRKRLGQASIVLVGIMGCGKSSVGRRLAQTMGLHFVDADAAIEEAANMTISEIFAVHGEEYFRAGERRVIARLLQKGPQILATGGGAFMNETTREAIAKAGVSLWLDAEFDVVMARVRKRSTRPLLQNPDPEGVMRKLMQERYPIYRQAQLRVLSRDVPHDQVVLEVIEALERYFELPSAFDAVRDERP